MSRRGIHPLLMGLDKPDRKAEDKPLERPSTQMAGLESPQHNRFLRAQAEDKTQAKTCLLYTSPSPRDLSTSRMPSSA